MTRRLLLSYLIVTALVLVLLEVPLAVFYSQRERERIAADVEHDATVLATLYEDDLENGLPLDSVPADQYRDRIGARVVVVDRDGITQVDTDQNTDRDFSTRPEIESALAGNTASGTRSSETLGTDLLYVAVPVASGGIVHGALRVTLDTSDVNARIHRFWRSLAGIAAVVLAVVAVIGWGIARSVTRPIRQLNRDAARFAHGDLTVSPEPITGPPEVRALADTMSTMASRLDELLRSQRRFIADASHQLRTPLTALRLRLDNIQSQLPGQSTAELDAAIDETTRLAALVTSLLQLARADEHHATGIADLSRLTTDRVDTWSAVADANGVTLIADTPPGNTLVEADPAAVEQILDNLLDNALNASPPGSTITARVTSHPATRDLTVSDQGTGLSDEDKILATQRFWRGSTTTSGTGLGLAIVDSLATASHATIHLADSPEGGLAVTISFPAPNPTTGQSGGDV